MSRRWINNYLVILATATTISFPTLQGSEPTLPPKIETITHQPKYQHSFWAIFAKDAETGKVVIDLNSDKLVLPASTTKLFSTAALLHAYGDDYRFETPVYAVGKRDNGKFSGNLILVGKGDLTFGGRQIGTNEIAFTKLDHIIANSVPGVILTPQDPLHAIKELAKQVKNSGITEIEGDVLVDDRYFETTDLRGNKLSPIMINENLIDFTINPGSLAWRPMVEGYTVTNEIKAVAKGEATNIEITSDKKGKTFTLKGTIAEGEKDLIRTASIKNPPSFARHAFIEALKAEGVKLRLTKKTPSLPAESEYAKLTPVATWISPPLTEYVKLILKVSHNTGADLVPLLLAVKQGKKTFDEGMLLLGKFVTEEVGVDKDSFVFLDAAGGDDNRLTPLAETKLLHYEKSLGKDRFKKFYDALPILAVDGSLEDFGKGSSAAGKARAKPGTGIRFNPASNQFFLTTQAYSGYIEGKNGHLFEFMIAINNGKMPQVTDIFPIFEDLALITDAIYEMTGE